MKRRTLEPTLIRAGVAATLLPATRLVCSSQTVIGEMVNGNRMYGRWTGRDVANLADGRDLPVYTDFRLVFAEVPYTLFGDDPTAPRAVDDMVPGRHRRSRALGLLEKL